MDGSPQEVGQTPWAEGLEGDLWLGQQELACQVSLKRVKPWPCGAVGSRSPSVLWEDALLPLEAEQGPTLLRSLWDQQCHLGADGGNNKSPPLRGCADSPGTGPPRGWPQTLAGAQLCSHSQVWRRIPNGRLLDRDLGGNSVNVLGKGVGWQEKGP